MNERVVLYIPAFNVRQFLPGCIAAVRAQTYPVEELVVVDEPMVGLDPRGAVLVKTIFKNLCAAGSGTVFLSTHTLEVAEEMFSDEVKELVRIERRIKAEVESVLGVVVDIKLVEPRSIARSEGKAVRVIDRRSI